MLWAQAPDEASPLDLHEDSAFLIKLSIGASEVSLETPPDLQF